MLVRNCPGENAELGGTALPRGAEPSGKPADGPEQSLLDLSRQREPRRITTPFRALFP